MIKKLLAIIMLVMVASLSIAGCTSSTNSSQTASSASHAASSAASTTARTTTSASASATRAPPHLKVLFFYEPNCPYCAALKPHVTQLQKTYAGKVLVQSIVSYTSPLTDEYKVPSVPTLILLNNGREVGHWVDATNTTGISAQINSLLRAS
jgi:thioredoxin-like negative regulator of GroEL